VDNWLDDRIVAEELSVLTDLAVADMLGPIVTAAYTHDPETAAELIATIVRDIRAGERYRLGQ
jgi:hypothetical protein